VVGATTIYQPRFTGIASWSSSSCAFSASAIAC